MYEIRRAIQLNLKVKHGHDAYYFLIKPEEMIMAVKQIDRVLDNEVFEYTGDVRITGSIGKNATVIVKNGTLTVEGDVNDDAEIKMQRASNGATVISTGDNSVFSCGGMFSMGGVVIGGNSKNADVCVRGNVGNNVTIETHNASIILGGDVGTNANITTHNGQIRARNIGSGSSLFSSNGGISVANIEPHVSLTTSNGPISAGDVKERATLNTSNGPIHVRSAHSTARLNTFNAEIYENGVPRAKNRPTNSFSIPGNGVTVFGKNNVVINEGGRTIVDGVDVTDFVNTQRGSSAAASSSQQQEPTRYMKPGRG